MKKIQKVPPHTTKDSSYTPPNILEGKPIAQVNNSYTDDVPSSSFSVGAWSSTKGRWSFKQESTEEFCVITEGKVRLVGIDGSSVTFQKGDAFVIPIGFEGTWETIEPVKKYYAVAQKPVPLSKL